MLSVRRSNSEYVHDCSPKAIATFAGFRALEFLAAVINDIPDQYEQLRERLASFKQFQRRY